MLQMCIRDRCTYQSGEYFGSSYHFTKQYAPRQIDSCGLGSRNDATKIQCFDNFKLPEELQELLNRSSNDLSRGEVKELGQFLHEFKVVLQFGDNHWELGRTSLVQHRINTGDTTPIRQTPRRPPLSKQEEISRLVQDMLTEGVIEPSSSTWSSPVVLVAKKDGGLCFCVDYRRLNDVTKKDCYPLPRVDDTLNTLSGGILRV